MTNAYLTETLPYSNPLAIIGFVASILSLIGIILVVLIFVFVPETRANFFFMIGFMISVSDIPFIASSLHIQNPNELPGTTCELMGVSRQFGILCSIILSGIIAWSVYYSIKENKSDEDLFNQKWTYILLATVPSAVISTIPVFISTRFYGPSGNYCWITGQTDEASLILAAIYYGPMLITFAISLYWYRKTFKILQHYQSYRMSGEFLKLMLYPIVMVVCNIGGFYFLLNLSQASLVLEFIYVILRQSQGLLNCIVFVTNYGVRVAIRRRLRELKPKTFDSVSESSTESFFGNRDLVLSRYFEDGSEDHASPKLREKDSPSSGRSRPYIVYQSNFI